LGSANLPWDWADDGAAEVYFALSRKYDAIQAGNDERLKHLSQRVCENANRISTIVSVGRGASAVSRRDVEFGIKIAENGLDDVVYGAEEWMHERYEFPRFVEKVFRKIDAACPNPIPLRELKRGFRNNQAWGNELDRVLKQLLEEDRIAKIDNCGTSNNPSVGFISKR
jgi:hypothetical protein